MKLKAVGFFKEFNEYKSIKTDKISIQKSISHKSHKNAAEIINYLKSGFVVVCFLNAPKDVIDHSNVKIPCSAHILTDGFWAWPGFLSYYVEKYNIKLNSDFLLHMEQNGWSIPSEIGIDLNDVLDIS